MFPLDDNRLQEPLESLETNDSIEKIQELDFSFLYLDLFLGTQSFRKS